MKPLNLNATLLSLMMLIFTVSCNDDIKEPTLPQNIVPQKFTVDIPPSLTSTASNGRVNGRTSDDELNGGEIYELLGAFILIAEFSGDVIEEIMGAISTFGLNQATIISYQSDDDGRTKNLEVVEGVTFESVSYAYQLTITDADSESNADGGKAMQIFWNTDPVQGVAILKPFNIDRVTDANAGDAVYRIDYSEVASQDYEAHMTVTISGLPLANPLDDPYAIDNLKMFVGKNGEVVDVYGNSNHPNASFFTTDAGFSWAFVASGIDNSDIGVAEVGLPPNNLNTTDRAVIMEDYSIKNVFTEQILAVWPNIEQSQLDAFLFNTEAPGYFNEEGFIQGGTSPGPEFDPLATRIQDLVPFNPSEINDLQIQFK